MAYKPFIKLSNDELVELPLCADKIGTNTIGSSREPIFIKDGVPNKCVSIVDLVYPVGSLYMSVNSANPETLFGGKWEQLKDRFLLGAGTSYNAGDTGGEATHKLSENEIPSHKHSFSATTSSNGKHSHVLGYINNAGFWSTGSTWCVDAGSHNAWGNSSSVQENGAHTHTILGETSDAGNGIEHNNMPPYLVVYMWKRTA